MITSVLWEYVCRCFYNLEGDCEKISKTKQSLDGSNESTWRYTIWGHIFAFHGYYSWRLPVQGTHTSSLHSCVGKICPPPPPSFALSSQFLWGPHRNKHSFHFIRRFQTAPGYCWPTLCEIIFEWNYGGLGARLLLELKIPPRCTAQHLICCF